MSDPSAPGKISLMQFDPRGIEMMLLGGIPHCGVLGLKVLDITSEGVTAALPYKPEYVGDPDSGVLHGGVVTTLIDTLCGMAVLARVGRLIPIATLDLRIDYLKPAGAGKDVLSTAVCYKTTRNIGFTRARAYHADAPDDLLATCAGTFMLESSDHVPLPGHVEIKR